MSNYFWAYKLKTGGVIVRKWFDNHDIDALRDCKPVGRVMDRFIASGFPDAEKIATIFLNQQGSEDENEFIKNK